MGLNRAKVGENGEIKHFTQFFADDEPANGLSDNNIQVLHEDKAGNIWVATAGGVNLASEVDGKTVFKSFPALEKVSGKIQALSVLENELWIGTNSGLYRFDLRSHRLNLIEEEDVFFNLSITALVNDSQKNIWAASNDGLFRIQAKSLKIKHFGVRDGLSSLEFSPGAAYLAGDGDILMGTKNGYISFNAQNIQPNAYKPKVILTDFKLFNTSVPFGNCSDTMQFCLPKHIGYLDEIVLSYRDYVFSFDFLALSFRHSDKNEYAYKLENFDQNWNFIGTKRSATYSSLPAGEYTFMVKAANSEGIWSDEPYKIRVIVTPPFWQTYWFIFLVILALTLLIYGALKLRIITIEARNRALEILVKEHTVEIIDKNFELEKQKTEVVKTYENIRILNEIGRKITSTLSFDEVVETIYQNLNEILEANGFGIGIYNNETQAIHFDSFIESGKRLEGRAFDVKNDIEYYPVICFLRKQSIFISDLEKQHELYSDKEMKIVRGEMPLSFIYVPLFSKGKINGVITVQSMRKNAYSEYQLNLLESLATYISTALDNAGAYSKIEEQKKEIEENSKNLRDSINYAKRIQSAMLPDTAAVAAAVGDAFIYLLPRDVVSGDFYWYSEIKENGTHKVVLAAVDCTGHGVPGAFMSMSGHAYLNQIVNVQKIYSPDLILAELHNNIIRTLQKNETQNRDGMDAVICVIDKINHQIEFSGAKNPLVYIKNSEISIIKGNKESVGEGILTVNFEKHTIPTDREAIYYIFSDGYEDQFGGAFGRKILRKNFYELLKKVHQEPLVVQKNKLADYFMDWKGTGMQIDDVLLIGFKVH
jgi:serine phosphatase RsbU (regulator of sigma subunit)